MLDVMKVLMNKAKILTSKRLQSVQTHCALRHSDVEVKRTGLQWSMDRVLGVFMREISSHWMTWGRLLGEGGT